ncbi:MAG TPA: glycosyltransferase, partial [Allosphingosinicella sp.]|nr:glycosyltransferase [Allosphingosinicella sp.]
MSGSVSHGVKLLIAAEADPSRWSLQVSLARALSELDIRTFLIPTRFGLDDRQREEAAAVPDLVLIEPGLGLDPGEADPARLMDARLRLADLARALDIDLVQVDQPALADARFPCPVVALHLGCPVTRWEAVHDGPLPDPFAWRSELIRAGLDAADVVICPSLAHAQRVKTRFALRDLPFVVHPGRAPLAVRGSAQHDYVLTAGPLWDESRNLAVLDAAAGRIGVPVRAAGPVRSPKGDEVIFDNLHCLGNLGEEEISRWLSARPVFVSTALYDPLG